MDPMRVATGLHGLVRKHAGRKARLTQVRVGGDGFADNVCHLLIGCLHYRRE